MHRLVPVLVLALAAPAMAQERSAAQQETLIELARVLGEAQALRQVCAGPDDPAWRSRFEQMLDVEVPDEKFDAKLRAAFDAGHHSRRGDFAACGPASRLAEAEAALEGRDLAAGLAQATVRVHPDEIPAGGAEPMAEADPPR